MSQTYKICGNLKLIKIRQLVGILDVRTNKWILGRVREINPKIQVSNESNTSPAIHHTLYYFDYDGMVSSTYRDYSGFRLVYCNPIPSHFRYGGNDKATLEYIIDSYNSFLSQDFLKSTQLSDTTGKPHKGNRE